MQQPLSHVLPTAGEAKRHRFLLREEHPSHRQRTYRTAHNWHHRRRTDLTRRSSLRKRLPNTHIQILSNGRQFADGPYAEKLAQVSEGMVIVGVPFHSDSPIIHDRIAGAKNAYNQTLLGLYNLAANDIDIELRIVLTKQNYQRLPQMAHFISKNLAFVSTVAFMAMEDIGYTIKNRDLIWIEPLDYMPQLQQAVQYLAQLEFDVSLFNLPLCLLSESLRPFAKQSISDWKNKYLPICDECTAKSKCCGFFSTSMSIYRGVTVL